MASIIGVLEGFTPEAYVDLVVSVHEPSEGTLSGPDLANDTWRRMTDLLHSRKEQVMAIAAAHRLNPGAMNALLFIEPGQPCSMRTLADAWKCDASNVTWLVDRLEEHGLAERRAHPGDRRIRTVALTRKGAKIRSQVEARLYEAPDILRELRARDLEVLAKVLRKI